MRSILGYRRGLTALITVMILGSVALITALVIAMRGSGEVDLGLSTLHGQQADVTLMGCIDDALLRLSRSRDFTDGGILEMSLGNGTCKIQVHEVPGVSLQTYSLAAQAERGRSKKCAYVQVVVPSMQIGSWKQVPCSGLGFDEE